MAQQSWAGLAVLIALGFALMALAACANLEQARGPTQIAAVSEPPATPEFHNANIGADALRARISAE